ncbi:SDR family NAD(P)-dependent oxidoreductase [Umezakia ovalisporum]|jgi:NAD(P)-dependent dehydrogenase (short-subunit alcohol dehydrogenase family)|uniref:SDR family NAD(P)-dependent oxidoreductase n=2 Tax=Umezakia ovalisporum TaxID=75695 RepID=A0AA43KF66_9CYAN|nr:SDR family NAD(P)-dependent oxidoreductase [Umezakia ovalisporum]MDH6056424.1 SDR family NAD(P)-dependent oxidoreductase [Umezakia ovalisporum FSS-43]MDH6064424.1 SDR family NAD(P)-dependent oxidoreductase [Umezakia ovalisporum FSS-62]MDH6068124.1 SDR family NAD(P)-dependent oxidoreductase [Umezakia ovalisporum APH033B]MDH6072696.1 SDR family NAD(P)-dependent oxidoreductase [Umezakia ovalisporum CobakiLakeA]MDH6075672.1 SDR family NAD(P)-dependent oxidoreductase [Umezakia ovalisporum CS-103
MNSDLEKVCIVTGGNSGVGLMTALGLAEKGYHVFIGCRSMTKATKALKYIRDNSGNNKVEFLPLNLASLKSVRQFVDLFTARQLPLHILVNNAGIFHHRGTTEEGFELIWGTNYLGHFLLTYLLLEKLEVSAPSRIVMVSSDLALGPQHIPWDLLVKKTPLNFLELYSVSKLCLLLLTSKLAKHLAHGHVTVNAVHPGFVQSNITIGHRLSKYLGLGITPEQGANSSLFCATSRELEQVSGKFFNPKCQEITLPKIVTDVRTVNQLWERSLIWTGYQQHRESVVNNYDNFTEISGPYRLKLDSKEIADITKTIFADVLPKPPHKLLFLHLLGFLVKFKFGSFLLLLLQLKKQQFNMERHIDSPEVWKLCCDENLLVKLQEYLGQEIVLWRSEIWANYPAQELIPFWHQDSYPKLLVGEGKTINIYIALTEVNQFNGFEFIPTNEITDTLAVKVTDPFSGNNFFEIKDELAKKAVKVVLKPGEFIMFTDNLIHRSVCNTSGQTRLSLTLRLTQPSKYINSGYNPNFQRPVLLVCMN